MWSVQPEFLPTTIQMVCFVCKSDLRPYTDGRDGHEPALDTGVDVEWEGRAAICETCIVEAASMVGMTTAAKSDQMKRDLDESDAHVENLERSLAVRDAALDILRQLPQTVAEAQPTAKK